MGHGLLELIHQTRYGLEQGLVLVLGAGGEAGGAKTPPPCLKDGWAVGKADGLEEDTGEGHGVGHHHGAKANIQGSLRAVEEGC